MQTERAKGIRAALISAFLLGLSPVLGRQAILFGFSPLAVVALRTGFAAILLFLIVALFRRQFLFIYPVGLMGCMLAGIINGFGSICTAIVMIVFAVTKFREGAWIVLIIIPLLVSLFFTIHRHYKDLAGHLTLDKFSGLPARQTRHRVIMPLSGVHQGTLEALHYAKLLSDDVTAVHISLDPAETDKVQKKWRTWGDGTRLVILDSPFRLFIEPLLEYIEEIIDHRQPNETITIVVPQFMPSKRWHYALHMRTADVLRQELLSKHGVVVTDVPYHVHKEEKE